MQIYYFILFKFINLSLCEGERRSTAVPDNLYFCMDGEILFVLKIKLYWEQKV